MPAGAPPEAPVEQQAPSLREQLAEATGLDASTWSSDQEALQAVRGMAQAMPRLTGLAQVGQAAMQGRLPDGVSPAEQQQAQVQQPEVDPLQEHFTKVWKAPQEDPQWNQMLESGAIQYDSQSGQYVAAVDWVPANIVAGMNAHAQFKRDAADRLVREFPKVATEVLEPWVEEKARRIVYEAMGQQQGQSQLEQFVQQNANILFHVNDQGGFVVDQATGQPVPSPVGIRFGEWMQHLASQGLQGMPAAEYALRLTAADMFQTQMAQQQGGNGQQGQQQPQQPVQPVPSSPQPGQPQGQQPFLQAASERAMVQSSASGGGGPEEAQGVPQVQSMTNLRGFLARNARQQGLLPPETE
jgi:hypothetical protein